ncbi:MAG: protein kinase [Acidobacteria bacterium]|nr:protein kinase [Acidobacteriota bacterium]
MNPDRWLRIKAVFQEACEIDAGERARYLAQACGDDADLRSEVEKLIAADAEVNEAPKRESARPQWPRIGPYEIIREIGRGGMGTVYLAARADHAYAKQVAIKVIRRGFDTESLLRRFRKERQILAALEHPYIAALYDGGSTEAGLPYMVMEYVRGEEILSYCDTRCLTVRQRLDVFRRVCSAIHYAHQKLVIHRDIKPCNILVTENGGPKLLDFGISKLLDPDPDRAALAPSSFPMMTPEYASPEQVRGGRVTTASDVYSLGVLLYELLTAQRPCSVEDQSPAAMIRAICEIEPEKPSIAVSRSPAGSPASALAVEAVSANRGTDPAGLRRALSGDLDTIILTALSKEPDRRYASVELFAEDLRRHMEDLPVAVRRGTMLYYAEKWIRRNRTAAIVGGGIALSLLIGLGVMRWRARVERQERESADLRLDERRRLATSDLLQLDAAMETSPDPAAALKRRVTILEELCKADSMRVDFQRDLAKARATAGTILLDRGDHVSAIGQCEGAAQIYERLTALEPSDPALRLEQTANLRTIGLAYAAKGEPSRALEYLTKPLAEREKRVEAGPDRALPLALLYNDIGKAHVKLGDRDHAVDNLQIGLQIVQAITRADPDDTRSQLLLSDICETLGNAYRIAITGAAPSEQRDSHLRARAYFVRTKQILDELSAKGKLSLSDLPRLKRMTDEIAKEDIEIHRAEALPRSASERDGSE